jgi:hypothetical protein
MTVRTVNTTAEVFTLTGTTHDTITITAAAGAIRSARIINLDATTRMWVAAGVVGQTVPTAVAEASNTHPVEANAGWWALDFADGYYGVVTLDVVGSGNKYVVEVDR